jgi:hypothetical protein
MEMPVEICARIEQSNKEKPHISKQAAEHREHAARHHQGIGVY